MLALVEALSRRRLLFASLASSAFLIYLDPRHGTNAVRTLVVAQVSAALLGPAAFLLSGPGYAAAGAGMVTAIVLMIVLDAVHPPAVSTALAFALRAGDESNVALFGLAVGMTAGLVVLQRAAVGAGPSPAAVRPFPARVGHPARDSHHPATEAAGTSSGGVGRSAVTSTPASV